MGMSKDEQKKIHEIRSHNISHILNQDFGGDIESFAEKIKVKKETITKYLNPSSDRPCGDRTARKIESALGKPLHALDFFFDENKDIYYVAIGTNSHHTYEVVKLLQNEEAVQECSVVFGDVDIWMKVEVESFRLLDILLAKIVKMPGVKRSQTYFSVKTLHWQRAQKERMNLPERDEKLYFKNGMEEFVHRKMIHHFNEIRELERGEISIKDEENLILEHHQIITGSEESLMATRNPREEVPNFDLYIKTEENLIRGGVQSKRLIFLSPDFRDDWDDVVSIHQQYIDIGCEIKFLMREKWRAGPLSKYAEVFIIIDSDFVCVRRDDQGRVLVKRSQEMIEEYTNTFLANWQSALVFNDVVKLLRSSNKRM